MGTCMRWRVDLGVVEKSVSIPVVLFSPASPGTA